MYHDALPILARQHLDDLDRDARSIRLARTAAATTRRHAGAPAGTRRRLLAWLPRLRDQRSVLGPQA